MGYAKVCFATDNDLGRGPTIARGVLNPRAIVQNGVNQLKILFKNRKLDQYSKEQSRHITLLVRRRAIDTSALADNIMQDTYPEIVWAANLDQLIASTTGPLALVADGNHRATTCDQLGTEVRKSWIKCVAGVRDMDMAMSNSPELALLRDSLAKSQALLKQMCSWHCTVYDWGKILVLLIRRNEM